LNLTGNLILNVNSQPAERFIDAGHHLALESLIAEVGRVTHGLLRSLDPTA